VLTASILCSHPLTNTPVALLGAFVARFPISRRPSSCFNRLGFHIARFEACSVFILLRGCLLADPACRTSDLRGFVPVPLPARHAPTASGWSNSCRVGYLPPTGSTRPFHGALKPWAVLYSRFAAVSDFRTGHHPSGYSSNRASKRFRSVSRALSAVSSVPATATHNAINPSRSPRSTNSESIRPSGVQLW
jgi:hypothetical protein